jgi:hypothetical protein
MAPIDRTTSPYVRTPAPAPDMVYRSKQRKNHVRDVRQNIKILKIHTYEALYQRTIRIEFSAGEKKSPYGTNTKNTNFPTQYTLDAVALF